MKYKIELAGEDIAQACREFVEKKHPTISAGNVFISVVDVRATPIVFTATIEVSQ